ncbi:MAG: (deoxy)nucleoside triphosphate pyrophosphohydrolase [Bradymonadia bacterium]
MTERITIRVVAAEIERDGKFLITQRRPSAVLPLLWEFPSGRVEDGETDETALIRELAERLNVQISVQQLSMFIKHEYEDYALDFCVYRCALLSEDIETLRVHDWRWVTPQEMETYEFPPADAQTIQKLLEHR